MTDFATGWDDLTLTHGRPAALDFSADGRLFVANDNNGVVVQMPAVAPPGAATLGGTIYFGINTQADNALGAAKLFTLDGEGTFVTTFAGAALPSSFIDSGSNGYFFSTNSFPACSDAPSFYCPSAPVVESATITGVNGAAQAVGFSIGNADQLFNVDDTAYPDLGGTNGDFSGATGFDWGLPFFFGRSVYVLFEEQTLNGTAGPAVGF